MHWSQNQTIQFNMETFIQETMLEDTSICDKLIEYHQKNMEYKGKGQSSNNENAKISTDVTVFIGNKNKIIHSYLLEVVKSVSLYLKKYNLESMFAITLRESFNIQHYAPNEGFLGWHCERSQTQTNQRALVFMTYLNDVTDGGETEYYFQKLKVKPVKGKMVVWPTDFTHLHRGITSPTQEKYIATGWYNFVDITEQHKIHQQKLQKSYEKDGFNYFSKEHKLNQKPLEQFSDKK